MRTREEKNAYNREYRKRPEAIARAQVRQADPQVRKRDRERGRIRDATTESIRYRREYRLRVKYGITSAQWAALFLKQNECCAVCYSPIPKTRRNEWHTDHDHTTGKVRGILCQGCNIALGAAQDNPVLLRELAAYLEASKCA